jgi:hypothetical protein
MNVFRLFHLPVTGRILKWKWWTVNYKLGLRSYPEVLSAEQEAQ